MSLWLTVTEEKRTMDNAVLMEIENLRRASLAGLRGNARDLFDPVVYFLTTFDE